LDFANGSFFILAALNLVIQGAAKIPAVIKEALADIVATEGGVEASGAVQNPSLATVLAAITNTLVALKADPNLPADTLSKIQNFETIVQDAIAAEKLAQTGEQPIGPLDPVTE
jgi:hypothetical protein